MSCFLFLNEYSEGTFGPASQAKSLGQERPERPETPAEGPKNKRNRQVGIVRVRKEIVFVMIIFLT